MIARCLDVVAGRRGFSLFTHRWHGEHRARVDPAAPRHQGAYGIGGLVMTLGFCMLALTHNFHQYLFATAILGLGFASCATVPAVYLLTGWMPGGAPRRSANS